METGHSDRSGRLGLGPGFLSLFPTPPTHHRPSPCPPSHSKAEHALLLLPLGLGVQAVVASLGLELRPPRMAADVGDRAVAEVSPENLSETRVMAVTGW